MSPCVLFVKVNPYLIVLIKQKNHVEKFLKFRILYSLVYNRLNKTHDKLIGSKRQKHLGYRTLIVAN